MEELLEQKETRKQILNAINKLEKENSEIFIRRFFLHYSIKDISKINGLSENAISNRIRLCKIKLLEVLKGEVI